MNWIGRLFGTQKAISDITDKDNGLLTQVGGWLGDMSFTDEERARWGLKQLDALQPFKIIQRIISLSVMILFVFVGLNVVAGIWVEAIWGIKVADAMLKFAFSDYVFWPTLSVLSLYMSGGVMPGIFNKDKSSKNT